MMNAEIGSARTTSVLIDWLVWNVKPQLPVTNLCIQSKYCDTMDRSSPRSCFTAWACAAVAPGPVFSATTTSEPPGKNRRATDVRNVTAKTTIASCTSRFRK